MEILNEQNPSMTYDLNLLPDFPLDSIQEFKQFCYDLNDNEQLRKQFVSLKSKESNLCYFYNILWQKEFTVILCI